MRFKTYTYKAPLSDLLSASYIAILTLSVPIVSFLQFFHRNLHGKDMVFMILLLIFSLLAFFYLLFDLWGEVLVFKENRRNPSVVVDDESVLLPFEEDKQRVRLYFRDIKECKESYTSRKKKKSYFIYLSSKLDEDTDYRLHKQFMKAEDYEDMKALLLKKTRKKK